MAGGAFVFARAGAGLAQLVEQAFELVEVAELVDKLKNEAGVI